MKHKGRLITFEGIDGSGKTTQLRLLADWLTERGFDVVTTREPGGTPLGATIRTALLDCAPGSVDPLAELLLYAADRAQHVRRLIRPAIAAGRIVLCDRFGDATIAYQGYGRKLPLDLIARLNQLATDGIAPDLTLLYDLEVGVGLARTIARQTSPEANRRDRLDLETEDFHQRVRRGYLALAAEASPRFRTIPAAGSVAEVFEMTCRTALGCIEKPDDQPANVG
ncbi:MAG: dTMP kinase [Blastocatellia bacterium]